jgi:hypothetical protein
MPLAAQSPAGEAPPLFRYCFQRSPIVGYGASVMTIGGVGAEDEVSRSQLGQPAEVIGDLIDRPGANGPANATVGLARQVDLDTRTKRW